MAEPAPGTRDDEGLEEARQADRVGNGGDRRPRVHRCRDRGSRGGASSKTVAGSSTSSGYVGAGGKWQIYVNSRRGGACDRGTSSKRADLAFWSFQAERRSRDCFAAARRNSETSVGSATRMPHFELFVENPPAEHPATEVPVSEALREKKFRSGTWLCFANSDGTVWQLDRERMVWALIAGPAAASFWGGQHTYRWTGARWSSAC